MFILLKDCNKTWLKTLSIAALFAVSFLVKNAFSFFLFSVVSSAGRGAELWIIQDHSLTRTEASEHSGVPPYLYSLPSCPLHLYLLSLSSPTAFHLFKIHNLGWSFCPVALRFVHLCPYSLISPSLRSLPYSSLSGHLFGLRSLPSAPSLSVPFNWKMFQFKWNEIQNDLLSEQNDKNRLWHDSDGSHQRGTKVV